MAAYQSANPNDVSIGNDAVWDDLEKMNDDVSRNRKRGQIDGSNIGHVTMNHVLSSHFMVSSHIYISNVRAT
jgi:hypothetical protein